MLRVQEPWFSEIIAGRKTIEGRAGKAGDRDEWVGTLINVMLDDDRERLATFEVMSIRHYDNLMDYLMAEGWVNCAPHAINFADAVEKYIAVENYLGNKIFSASEIERRGGINAIKLSKV
jgi:ASC-1-like (ASCH) protein